METPHERLAARLHTFGPRLSTSNQPYPNPARVPPPLDFAGRDGLEIRPKYKRGTNRNGVYLVRTPAGVLVSHRRVKGNNFKAVHDGGGRATLPRLACLGKPPLCCKEGKSGTRTRKPEPKGPLGEGCTTVFALKGGSSGGDGRARRNCASQCELKSCGNSSGWKGDGRPSEGVEKPRLTAAVSICAELSHQGRKAHDEGSVTKYTLPAVIIRGSEAPLDPLESSVLASGGVVECRVVWGSRVEVLQAVPPSALATVVQEMSAVLTDNTTSTTTCVIVNNGSTGPSGPLPGVDRTVHGPRPTDRAYCPGFTCTHRLGPPTGFYRPFYPNGGGSLTRAPTVTDTHPGYNPAGINHMSTDPHRAKGAIPG
ncbi:hypothetical protein FIBSPDRAFT_899470 [Athelia psychrophila]|uniref:Uncharacterized protein n=1 Tax=Athelia psychrophila TaxID=1759441 RepID=A0A165ZM79_9AGAM|nr:hypothetical protein FIBSPDRAFT_899470 [Fibularhizoctonia sp. CBS 109695]